MNTLDNKQAFTQEGKPTGTNPAAKEPAVKRGISLKQCNEAFLKRRDKISDQYDVRAVRSGWKDDAGKPKDDGSKARFMQTMPSYCKKAIDENRIVVDNSNPEYQANPAYAFYDQYIHAQYQYTAQKKNEVKQNYLTTGASAIVNGWDILNAFGLWKQIGRDEGNFVTSLKEDIDIFNTQGINLKKLIGKKYTPAASSNITAENAKKVALAKGLKASKFETGMYQYVYSPEFIRNANNKTKSNGESALFTANGDMNGANPLNLPGMMTWVEDKEQTAKHANNDIKKTAIAENVKNSESELMVPTIKLQPEACFNFAVDDFEDKDIDDMKELLTNGRPSLSTKDCFVKDKNGTEVFKGEIKGKVSVQVLKPAKLQTPGDWTTDQVKKDAEKKAKEAKK
ncbi:MAG: hypothetical protein IIY06_04555 [Proteobacteria bacterium]|nr:hypothetical protein [Pseudomonadota bacterium]